MGRPKVLAINVVTDSRRGVKGLQETESAAARMGRGVQKAGKLAGGALLVLGAAGIKAAKGAAEDEAAQVRLAGQLRRNASATRASIAATEKWIDRQARAKGIADDELRPALGKLVTATGSVEQSQKALRLAMDISAASGKPLEAVSAALAKGYGGNTAALGKLVPGIDKAILKSGDMAKVTDALSKKVGGTAVEAAQTNEGKMRRAAVAAGEFQETLGGLLLPAMEKIIAVLARATTYLEANQQTVTRVIVAVAALAAGILVINGVMKVYQATMLVITAATKAWAIATRILNAVMKANPIGLLITAIGLVVAGFVLAYKKSDTFRGIVQTVGKAGQTALNWIVEKAQAVADKIGKLGPAAQKGKDIFVKAIDLYTKPFQVLFDLVMKVVDAIGKIKVPNIGKALSKLPGVGGPSAPPVAPGGSVARGGKGGPGGGGATVPAGGGRYGGVTVVVNFNGLVTDKEGTARAIRDLLRGSDIRNNRVVTV
ncbi:phage tail tape measure protein [Aeromicrobium fastidiosum]|uniref:Phage tail tape measure protein n=1 Tax=Aeromicrobium fastidiosum TaxID=52699 RepID=A0A641ATF8_9ACTN|nr:hypothetical protein [Aeromicrobium fastidiosum]KAA1380523.1 hypothetical protein ESP62_004925 [Aeromicrobium fastidiosum]MBP2390115.1 hypothetical protein [Aeromicrobium fastidiosum]